MIASFRFLAATMAFSLLSLSVVGCGGSDNQETKDAGGDGASLFTCDNPGESCNPHDKCAIDPICGEDHICRATGKQNCDDGLACTTDKCLGAGKCEHEVLEGCALVDRQKKRVQCFKEAEVNPDNPCQVCDPSRDTSRWSTHSGLSCDDEDPCTADDRCTAGKCEGARYSCSDSRECTSDICDGVGGCNNALLDDWCLIKGGCYEDQSFDKSGCNICDVSTSQSDWTTLSKACTIGNRCYAEGVRDSSGCGVCDPDSNPSGWIAATDKCLIDGQCLDSGAVDSSGCGTCDPTQSTTAFSPTANKCLIDGACVASGQKSASGCGVCTPANDDSWWSLVGSAVAMVSGFEPGLGAWTTDAAVNGVGWQVDSQRAHDGTKSLYYGNPTTRTFENNVANAGAAQGPELSLPAGAHAALHFWAYLDVEASPLHDLLEVKVADGSGQQVVWAKTEKTRLRQWIPITVDLSDFAGQSVSIVFAFDSLDAWANASEGIYIDDVAVITDCGAL